MKFLSSERLWLLLLVPALAGLYVVMQARRRQYAVRFTNLALLDKVAPKRPGWRRHLPAAALLLAVTAMVVSLARPTREERVPRERATIVMAIDTSLSMEATDVEPSRLEAAKVAAMSFVDLVPDRLNVGLISFSGTAQILVPPTTDHALLKRSIATLDLGPRTAIGDAIFAALDSIESVPTDPGQPPAPARVVLMSDGERTVGATNEEAADAALQSDVPVYTIGFGTDEGYIFVEGQAVAVPVNQDELQFIADYTQGLAFEAATGEELKDVYADIGSSLGYRTEQREITTWFVAIALACALAGAAGSLVWFSRLP